MSIENPTLAHFRHFIRRGGFSSLFTLSHLYICREASTNQLLFMQNKPNVKDAQINVNSYMKSIYEKLDTWLSGKNKPNSNPIYERPKSLAGKSGHTRFCSWSDLRLLLWESSSSINNQTLIYELNHGYAKTYYERGNIS